jgi:cation:H+ antiporter
MEIATALGISDLVIGLTIVAIGTSLPELAASVTGALKGEHELAIGNVLGSNLYNLLAVLSLPGLIAPGPVSEAVLQRDLPLMLILTIAIFFMSHGRFSPRNRINRLEGALLLLCFAGYQFWLYHSATA